MSKERDNSSDVTDKKWKRDARYRMKKNTRSLQEIYKRQFSLNQDGGATHVTYIRVHPQLNHQSVAQANQMSRTAVQQDPYLLKRNHNIEEDNSDTVDT